MLLCQTARSARISFLSIHPQQSVDLPGRVAACKRHERLIADDTTPALGNRTLMGMTDGLTCRRSAAFSGINTSSSSAQITRRAHHQRLQPGCRQQILLSGLSTYNRLSATPIRHEAAKMSSITVSQHAKHPSLPSTCPGSSTTTPLRSLAASAAWAGDYGFTSSSKNQQQQYVKHMQHQDFPGGRQQQQKQSPTSQQWKSNSFEARHRKGGAEQGPVFSYQDLFNQEMTPTAAGASNGKGSRLQAQQSSKGFGSKGSKPRKAGGNGTGPTGPAKDAVPGKAHVQLCITRQVEYGQNMRVTGSDGLGSWNTDNGPKLKWNEGHKWSADLLLPPGGYEFKFLLEHRSGHLEWENGSNRTFEVPKTAAELVVEGDWNKTGDTEVLELEQHAAHRQEINELQNEDAGDRNRQATARAEAAAFAAANKAAAAAYKQQADAEAEVAALRAQKRAEALAAVPPAPADLFKFDLSVLDSEVPGSDQLMEVLLGFRQDMLEGLYGVTSTMQEIQEDLAQVQSQMNQLAAERFLASSGPVDAATAAALESGNAVPWPQQADTAAIIAADAAVANEQALSGLQGVVQTWQVELVNFRQDSMDLREEMEMLRHSLEGQMKDNTAALHDLESLVKQLMGAEGARVNPTAPQRPANVVAAAAVAPPPPSTAAGGVSGGPPGSSEMLDQEDKMLLERINHLASDLSAEMKEAVQELEQQQQSLLERHQHIISDLSPSPNSNNNKARVPLDFGFGFPGMRMQPTNNAGVLGGRGVQPAGHVVRATGNWLASHNVQQYHQGLMVAVLMSAGLWRDSMWDELDKGALRATYKSYKAVWSDACLQTWKDSITTKQALLTALSTGRQQLLSMHILWSLQELCTHCRQLQDMLPEVATPIELGLMQKLRQRGGAGQGWALGVTGAPVGGGEAAAAAQCAVLLQRWLSAADSKW